MKFNSKLICIILIVLVSVGMVACQTPQTGGAADANTQTPGSTNNPTDKPAEEIELKVLTQFLKENIERDSRVRAFYDSVERYMDENKNVNITVEAVAAEPYNDKAKVLAAGNELPDVFELLGSWNKSFVESGVLMNLTEIINADPEWKAIIKDTAVNNFKIGEDIYAICLEEGGSTTLLFYNEEILKECGVDAPPKNMDELLDSFDAIKAKGYTPISLGNKGQWVAQSCYLSAIGARYTGNDWNTEIVNRTGAKFTDPEFIKGLEVMYEMAERGAFNTDMNSIDYQQARVPYYNKEAAMLIEGYWAINAFVSDCPEDVLEVTHVTGIPECTDAKVPNYTAGGNGGWGFGLSSKLKGTTKDAAIGFMKTFLSKESASTVLEGGNPCAILPADYDRSKISRLHTEFFDYIATVPACDTYDLIFAPNVIEVMNKGLQELLINTVTPEDLAQRLQNEYEKTNYTN
jgi:raffinose/stachyose/melibiose transport system substrate-binding protein